MEINTNDFLSGSLRKLTLLHPTGLRKAAKLAFAATVRENLQKCIGKGSVARHWTEAQSSRALVVEVCAK